jgi:hypothetical protein
LYAFELSDVHNMEKQSPALNHRLITLSVTLSHLLAVGNGVLPLNVYLHVRGISANRDVEVQLFMLMGSIAYGAI